jgi:hypothetical protein
VFEKTLKNSSAKSKEIKRTLSLSLSQRGGAPRVASLFSTESERAGSEGGRKNGGGSSGREEGAKKARRCVVEEK